MRRRAPALKLDLSPSAERREEAMWWRIPGAPLPCTCLFGFHNTIGCPTHDPGNCPGIEALREEAQRRRLVRFAASQMAELVDADCCGGEDDAGNVRVVLLEPPRRAAHVVGTNVTIERLNPLGYREPVVTAVVTLAGALS